MPATAAFHSIETWRRPIADQDMVESEQTRPIHRKATTVKPKDRYQQLQQQTAVGWGNTWKVIDEIKHDLEG